ncbi:hypothetical protein NHJ6243_000448 [Beauveria neobassiana]
MAGFAPPRPPTDRYNSVEDYHNHVSVQTSNDTLDEGDHHNEKQPMSPNRHDDMTQLNDDLELLRAEQLISNQEHDLELQRSRSRNRTHHPVPEDAFNQLDTTHGPEKKRNEDASLYKLWAFLKKFPRFIRYFVYMLPVALLLLLPVLLGAFAVDKRRHAVGGNGGVDLMWFGIWLEIVWCSLWVSRMVTNLLPPIMQAVCKMGGSTTPKKWKDVGSQLELHAAMFLWFLAILISFKPTTAQKRVEPIGGADKADSQKWIDIVNKVIIALFVLFTLNFIEKIILQWIATSFHQRTYATRIENNKGDIRQIVQLFEHAKSKLEDTDTFLKGENPRVSGTQTPMRIFHENARNVLGKVGYVAGKVGNDLIGRKVNGNQPRKVVTELLRNTTSAYTLARLIYRSLVRPDRDTVHMEDIREVFATDEEADAAFMVFDKDLNGDISCQEFEQVCNEIHLEKKAIAASLKDLDSVIRKLDKVFLFIIVIISIIVFISILSGSAAAGLASASTSVLGLAWVLQATAQEFLQSIIFVFVKHPFDVGDRVTIYGSTGDKMTGDDYYVTEISLLYTEFKKMQGHIVQAPNSVLNNLFILNQRRSNGLADPVPLIMRFGTPVEKIDELKDRMRSFCLQNKRDYQATIISEMVSIDQLRSCTMNIIFFHKTNFQNELLRLNRHNRFVTELMAQMIEVGIQAPMRIEPGGSRDTPMYWSNMPAPPAYGKEHEGENPGGDDRPKPSLGPHRKMSIQRSHSTQREMTIMEEEAALTSFGDVFESRRDQTLARRMASIREKEKAEKASEGAEAEPRGSTTSAAVHRSSTESHRARLFSRPRRDTTTTRHENEMVKPSSRTAVYYGYSFVSEKDPRSCSERAMPAAGLATDLPDGWEWDYDGTRWFYTFKANGHVQYHFPSDGDEFPDFVGIVPAALEPEERLASHQQVKRATGAPPERKKKQSKDGRGNRMTATTPRPVGIEWDGDVGAGSSEEDEGDEAGSRVVFEPENLMFLGPRTYAEVSPLIEEEEEAAKRTVVGDEEAVVNPAKTMGKDTPATSSTEKGNKEGENGDLVVAEATKALITPEVKNKKPLAKKEESVVTHEAKSAEEPTKSLATQQSACAADPAAQQDPSLTREAAAPSPALPITSPPPGSTHVSAVELPVPEPPPFNPVGIIAEMPTGDTPRSHIELNPIPVEIMDVSVLAPIETAPSLGVAELSGPGRAPAAAVVKQTQQIQEQQQPQQQQQQQPQKGVGITRLPPMQMKIKRKPTDPNASIPSPMSASSSALISPSAVSQSSVASSPPASLPAPVATQYKPWAPVSPLLRADTEPAVPRPAMMTAQQQQQRAMTAPPSPVANPHLSHAPSVLRPAGRQSRQSTSVSPERKDGGSEAKNDGSRIATAPTEEPVQSGTVRGASPQNVSAPGMREGQMRPLGQAQPPNFTSQRGEMTARPHMQLQGQGPPQKVLSQPIQTSQPVQMPPGQMPLQDHRQPVSMAPGQYPPVPIPQPYNQYHNQPHRISQHPGPPWLASGQPVPSPSPMTPPVQQQPPTGWMRQSMPPMYPTGQQIPKGRHSLVAQGESRLVPLGSHYHPAPSSTSTPSEPPASQSRRRSSTADSLTVSPLRPRADSQPLGLVLPSPSPMETPQAPGAASVPHEHPTPGSAKVGTGPDIGNGRSKPTTDSYFPSSKERSADLVGDIADQFAAEMQAILGPGSEASDATPVTNTAAAKPEPRGLVGAPSLGTGKMLHRIEEHQAGNTPISASSTQDLRPSSVVTDLTLSTLQSTASQPQPSAPLQQTSPNNMLQAPQGIKPAINRKPAPHSHGAQVGMPLPGQMGPPGHAAQGLILGQGVAPQQQWQSSMQQSTQRPLSVPPQTHVQPSKSKENKWTKWFKSSKPEKKLSTSQIGMPQQLQRSPQGWMQPQQWQPGAPIQGHAFQHHSMQGQPTQGQAQGQPAPGQSIPGQPTHGQPMQSTLMARPMSLQPMPMNAHPPHQIFPGQGNGPTPRAMEQQGPLGSHSPQQYMPLQPGQPMQMRQPFGAPNQQMRPGGPVMQMQPPGLAGSPAQTTPLQHLQKSLQNSALSSQQTGQLTPQSEGPTASPMTNHLMPAPLSLRPKSEVPAGIPGSALCTIKLEI